MEKHQENVESRNFFDMDEQQEEDSDSRDLTAMMD